MAVPAFIEIKKNNFPINHGAHGEHGEKKSSNGRQTKELRIAYHLLFPRAPRVPRGFLFLKSYKIRLLQAITL
jgi:hypothetical protein